MQPLVYRLVLCEVIPIFSRNAVNTTSWNSIYSVCIHLRDVPVCCTCVYTPYSISWWFNPAVAAVLLNECTQQLYRVRCYKTHLVAQIHTLHPFVCTERCGLVGSQKRWDDNKETHVYVESVKLLFYCGGNKVVVQALFVFYFSTSVRC